MPNGFNSGANPLHKGLDLINTYQKGFKVEQLVEVRKTNLLYSCRCEQCKTCRNIFASELCSKKDRKPLCKTCRPPKKEDGFYSKPSSKYYNFYRLYHNANSKGKSPDFKTFFIFLDWVKKIMGKDYLTQNKTKLMRFNSTIPHSFTNSRIRVIDEQGNHKDYAVEDSPVEQQGGTP